MIIRSIKIYSKIVSTKFKANTQYRLNFFIGVINQVSVMLFEFIGVFTLLSKFGSIAGWTQGEIFLSYGIVNLSFSFAEIFVRGFEASMARLVRTGEYDRYLLRPISSVLQISAFNINIVRIGRAIVSILVLLMGVFMNIAIFNNYKVIYLIFICINGILLYASIYIFIGSLSFISKQSNEFTSIFVQGSVSTMQYPKTIFPKWIQDIFTYLIPISLISYYPVQIIIEKELYKISAFSLLSPGVGLIAFMISLLIFSIVEKKYVSSGN